MKIDLPETDYCNVAFFRFSIRAGLRKDGLSETFSSDGIKSSSPPPFQIDQNIQSDCQDGADRNKNGLVSGASCHLLNLLHLASHMGDGILKRVFNLSSPPSIPFLCLYLYQQQWSKAGTLNLRSQRRHMLRKKRVSPSVTIFHHLIYKFYYFQCNC